MTTLSGGDLIQVIDYDGEMTADLEKWIKDQGMTDLGFQFNVVTILGSQSSGKSTLMNCLFGCTFQVMDAQRGYSQTTKGLWAGRDNLPHLSSPSSSSSSSSSNSSSNDNSLSALSDGAGAAAGAGIVDNNNNNSIVAIPFERPVLILDVEGLDSRERGDKRESYENFFALFSLALADCLIMNISTSALGCHTSSGFGLLKTVMEAHLELFISQDNAPKTILLFVVRDWAPTIVPEDVMKEKIINDYVNKIWKEIEKPEAAANATAADFFTVEVMGLAHKLLAPQEFEKDVIRLRNRWVKGLSPKSYTRCIPADGFGAYAKNIWDTIKQQSHLDIPNQKEMLAIYRCQDLKQQALQAAAARAAAVQHQYLRPAAADAAAIREELINIANDAIEQYLSQATRYQQKICISIKAELIEGLVGLFKPIVEAQLSEARERIANKHKDELREAYNYSPRDVCGKGDAMLELWASFRKRSAAAIEAAEEEFREFSESCNISLESGEVLEFCSKIFAASLRQEMQQEANTIREKQQAALEQAIEEKCDEGFVGLDALLTARDFSPERFWELCRGRAAASATLCATYFAAAAKGCSSETEEGDSAAAATAAFAVRCRKIALWQLRKCLEKLGGCLHIYIIERFNCFFSFDEEEQPRRWELLSVESLDKFFLSAKSQALLLIPTLREVQLRRLSVLHSTLEDKDLTDEQDIAAAAGGKEESNHAMPAAFYRPLIDSISAQAIQRKAVATMQQQCREAQLLQQRCSNRASWRAVPLWGWVLLLCLGWDELGMVLSFVSSSWLVLPLLVLLLVFGAAVFLSGQFGFATHSAKQAAQLLRLLLQPLLHGLLRKATDMMDPSGLVGRGVSVPPPRTESKVPGDMHKQREVAELREKVAQHADPKTSTT